MKPTELDRKSMQARWNIAQAKKQQPTADPGTRYAPPLLPNDNKEEFHRHLAAYLETFAPRGHVEEILVTRLATLQWQILRAAVMQEAMLGLETDNCAPVISSTYSQIDRPGIWAIAYRSLEERSPAHHRLDLHISRLTRLYGRVYENLVDMQTRRQEENISETPTTNISPVNPITSEPEPLIDSHKTPIKEHR